ncbi:MAG: TIR domain-containing protein [Pseudomonadota bacterium]|nr:TIR domain-containing protein [Pseudomonadota bacterium]
MSDVFLSYKAEDRSRVKPLVDAMTADGLTVWWDAQIRPGSEWRDDIQEHLDGAACVIVAWSQGSVGPGGSFVRDEASRAQRRGVYLPVRIDSVEPPLGFGELHAVSLQSWKGDRSDPRYKSVLNAVRAIMAGKAPAPSVGGETRGLSRRTALIGGGAAAAAVAAAGGWQLLKPTPASARNSIAVLPFANLSGDSRQGYFADGIAEELRSALSRLDGLRVAGRISSEAVRDEDATTAARRLRVGTILTGSVRRAPGTIRISSQLIEGRTGLEHWSETYDRPDGNVLMIQTDIAEKVVEALSIQLEGAEIRALTVGGTASAEAHDLYLRAASQAHSDDSDTSLRQANALLDAALAIDPRFAKAYAAKGRNLSYIADVARSPEETAKGYAAAVAAAKRALNLAPRLPDGYAALADALYGQRKISDAIEQLDTGLSFAPNDLQLLQAAVIAYVAAGQTSRSLSYANRMVQIDPLNALSHRRRYYALFYDRQYDGCIAEAKLTQKIAPALALPAYFIALSLIMTGRAKEAQKYLETMPPDLTVRLAGEAIVAAKVGNTAVSDQKLEQLASIYGDAASYQFAQTYAQRGDADKAFAALARGFAVNDPGLNTLIVDPLLDPIRSDPRLKQLSNRLDFPS